MSQLASRSLILAASRLLNQGLLMLSPILLVRLLDVNEYGLYRQFTVTALFLAGIASFSISGSINYFVAKQPERSALYITNVSAMLAVTSLLMAGVLLVGHGWIVPTEIADDWGLVLAYVFLHVNVDVASAYWLARGRSDVVMFYSLTLASVRIGAVVGGAWLLRDVNKVFVLMVIVEAVRLVGVLWWLISRRLLSASFDRDAFLEQWRFVLPFGIGSLLYGMNDSLSKMIVSHVLGPSGLAIYTIAAFQVPILMILKTALTDVIFPDMVKRSASDPVHGLRLWQRTNVVYFIVILPAWLLMSIFAEPLVRLLFTDTYLAAVPFFQVFLLVMLRQCFDFSTPLRSLGNTRPFVVANVVGLTLNVGLTLLLIRRWGLWAPTLGVVVSQYWLMVYLGVVAARRYGTSIGGLLEWVKLVRVAAAVGVAAAVLITGLWLGADWHLAWIPSLVGFASVYLMALRLLDVEEFTHIAGLLRGQFGRWIAASRGR